MDGNVKKDDEKILDEAKKRFETCVDAEDENRIAALEDLRFSFGDQWDEKMRRLREADGRPCLVMDQVGQAIRQVVNDARQNRPSIKVRPTREGTDEVAEVLTGLIRNIEDQSNADIAYDWAVEYAVRMGWAYIRVVTEYSDNDGFEQDIRIRRIKNPFTVYMDPAAQDPTGADARYCFITEWVEEDELKAQYPKLDLSQWKEGTTGEGYEGWFQDKKVRRAEYWRVTEESKQLGLMPDGSVIDLSKVDSAALSVKPQQIREVTHPVVEQYLLTCGNVLERTKWSGRMLPIVRVLGNELDIEGKTFYTGLIRSSKDPQRMYNFARSAIVEYVALGNKSPWVGPEGFAEGFEDKWSTAHNVNHAYLEYKGAQAPSREPPLSIPPALTALAAESVNDIKAATGLYNASLGDQGSEKSGKAIIARQREGDTGTFHYVDNLGRAISQLGKILVDLIPKIYDTPRVIRTLGQDGTSQEVTVNQPYIDSGVQKMYDLSLGEYDVTVTVGPSYATKRAEAAESMIAFIQAYPMAAQLVGDLIAKNMDWPGADEVAKRLQAALPPGIAEGQNPVMQQLMQHVQQLEQMIAQLQDERGIQQQELSIKAFDAGTKRIQAMTPDPVSQQAPQGVF